MNILISKSELNGIITVPVSKSEAHRVLIAAYFTGADIFEKTCNALEDVASDDIGATIGCLKGLRDGASTLDAGDSGSTLRFLLPVAAAIGRKCTFRMGDSLSERPLEGYDGILSLTRKGNTISVYGKLERGTYSIDGSVSSQYVSGMLFALSLLDGTSILNITGELKSRPYVDMTVSVLKRTGLCIEMDNGSYVIHGMKSWNLMDNSIEGDWSAAAYWLVLNKLGADIEAAGLDHMSLQGDRAIAHILSIDDSVIEVSVSDIPDLAPALAVYGTGRETGTSLILNDVDRLRTKESDRVSGIMNVINDLGGDVEYSKTNGGRLIIHGCGTISGGKCNAMMDHRLIMMAACLSYVSDNDIQICDAEYVSKSYPGFFDDLKSIGAEINIEENTNGSI